MHIIINVNELNPCFRYERTNERMNLFCSLQSKNYGKFPIQHLCIVIVIIVFIQIIVYDNILFIS